MPYDNEGKIKQNHDLAEQYEPADTAHLMHGTADWTVWWNTTEEWFTDAEIQSNIRDVKRVKSSMQKKKKKKKKDC